MADKAVLECNLGSLLFLTEEKIIQRLEGLYPDEDVSLSVNKEGTAVGRVGNLSFSVKGGEVLSIK